MQSQRQEFVQGMRTPLLLNLTKWLHQLLDTNICWTLFRQLTQFLKYDKLKKRLKAGHELSNDIALLTGCWIGCGNIVIHSSEKVCLSPVSCRREIDVDAVMVHISTCLRARQQEMAIIGCFLPAQNGLFGV